MTGDLLLRYDQAARVDADADAGHWKPIGHGVLDLLNRWQRSRSPQNAAKTELESAIDCVPSEWACPQAIADIREAFAKGSPLCESPIEVLLLPWLIAQEYGHFRYRPRVLLPGEGHLLGDMRAAIVPQLPIGRYRADFAIAAKRGKLLKFVVVECDGAAFHDGVENVKRDVDRDVAILSSPKVLDVVRLTGSEIMKSPMEAAAKAATAFKWCWDRRNKSLNDKFRAA